MTKKVRYVHPVSAEEQRCARCGEVKPAEAFARDPQYKSGLSGACRACVQIRRKGNRPRHPISIEEQECIYCAELKPASAFGRDGQNRSGLKHGCKGCIAERAKAKRWDDPDAARKVTRQRYLKSKYGMSPEEQGELFARQKGRCPICLQALPGDESRRAIDHCHVTNRVRGILHPTCNTLLHYFENPESRARIEAYLAVSTGNAERE